MEKGTEAAFIEYNSASSIPTHWFSSIQREIKYTQQGPIKLEYCVGGFFYYELSLLDFHNSPR